jgi:hypothetical protein
MSTSGDEKLEVPRVSSSIAPTSMLLLAPEALRMRSQGGSNGGESFDRQGPVISGDMTATCLWRVSSTSGTDDVALTMAGETGGADDGRCTAGLELRGGSSCRGVEYQNNGDGISESWGGGCSGCDGVALSEGQTVSKPPLALQVSVAGAVCV